MPARNPIQPLRSTQRHTILTYILINKLNMNDSDTPTPPWLTAATATQTLGIARQTLYAYVSRGLIRAKPDPDEPRRALYDPASVKKLLRRRHVGRARRAVAEATIDFGEPVLSSRVSRITDVTLIYRDQDAIRLAKTATLEETAALLWNTPTLPRTDTPRLTHTDPGPPIARALLRMARLAALPDWAEGGAALIQDGAVCLRAMAEAITDRPLDDPIHRHFARVWRLDEDGADLIRTALTLCADHELNASTFAVRVVASTGASLPHGLLAGLAALSGPRHGCTTARVRALLAESRIMADPKGVVAERLARGDELPGFGHRLYPDGDPRAAAILDPIGPAPRWRGLFAAIYARTGLRPNLDAALVALEQHLALPDDAALAIFAMGRTAGWIAHALEQRAEGRLIRPRTAYPA